LRHHYRFRNTPELADASITVENVGNRIAIAPDHSGPAALSALIRTYFDSFNAMTPIATHRGANVYSLYWPPVPGEPHARFFEDFVRTWFLKKPSPPVVTVAVTGDCQCRCIHCSADPLSGPSPIPYSLAELKRIIDGCLSIGVCNIIFLGGEPLLRKDLEACIAHVDPALAVTQIFTNAVALSGQRIASLKASGLNAVKISLDSPDPEEHDRLRGRAGTFRSVERGAKLALEAGLLVGLATYATNESVARGDLARIAERAAQWGVHEVTVFDVIPTGRLLQRQELMLTPERRNELLAQAARLNRDLSPAPRILTQSWTNSDSRFAKYIGCLAATSQFHITAAGDLTPCDFTPLSFGNVRSEPIDRIWKRLTEHSEFCRHSQRCRMQDPGFRARFIETLPAGAGLPYPIG
jgi:MoaA/NifB/PqqE/SkfB family radical SAM enzyme